MDNQVSDFDFIRQKISEILLIVHELDIMVPGNWTTGLKKCVNMV